MRRLMLFAGRSMMAGIFIQSGWDTMREPGERRIQQVAKIGMPNAEAMVRFNGAAMLLGGLGLAVGIFPRAAATGLVLSLIPTTYAGHRFWEEDDAATMAQQRAHFFKNVAIIGGLITYVALSGGDPATS
ncbi:MAG: DoxX family protein [Actinomycetota bacterium]